VLVGSRCSTLRQEKDLFRKNGASGEARTPDLVLRRHTLYPSELQTRGAACGKLQKTAAGWNVSTTVLILTLIGLQSHKTRNGEVG
jgi:hypothetical protein